MKRIVVFALVLNAALLGVIAHQLVAIAGVDAVTPSDFIASYGHLRGIVVQLGCEDVDTLNTLHADGRFAVQGLDRDAAVVDATRAQLHKQGVYGPVSARVFEGDTLPFNDNLVNVLAVSSDQGISDAEIMRVLAPYGVALIRQGNEWTKREKAYPDDIDEWTHFLRDASGNAVSKDKKVGPPRRLQWSADTLWGRSHEMNNSFPALVTAKGRMIYIFDTGITGMEDARLPENWTLIARDAFNGTLLWQRPLEKWGSRYWKQRALRFFGGNMARRLVVDGDTVYCTFEFGGVVSMLDADTGKTIGTIPGTEGAEEILVDGDQVVVGSRRQVERNKFTAAVTCYNARTKTVEWRKDVGWMESQITSLGDNEVLYYTGKELVCLERKDGSVRWKFSDAKTPKAKKKGKMLLIAAGRVILGGRDQMVAIDIKAGDTKWTSKGAAGQSMREFDLFYSRGQVWCSGAGGRVVGHDIKTGERVNDLDIRSVQSQGHHLRCYRAKATEDYLITQFRGVEFISLGGDTHAQNDWLRGTCTYGVMPANGFLYAPPHSCFCYAGSMFKGLNAFAGETKGQFDSRTASAKPGELEKGPAFGKLGAVETPKDWPAYRHDARRTGGTATPIAADLARSWKIDLKGDLTPPVAAAGRVFVVVKKQHTIHALAADTGKPLWTFAAGARIDSPPTIFNGMLVFGSADGFLYSVRASDGALAWRRRLAPQDRWLAVEGQLESIWRVHGSVAVRDGIAYCSAGRSSYVDGGLHLYGVDIASGVIMYQTVLTTISAEREDAKRNNFVSSYHIEGANSDILVAQGDYIYLNQERFTPELKHAPARYLGKEELTARTAINLDNKDYVNEEIFGVKWKKKTYETYDKLADLLVDERTGVGERDTGLHLFTTSGFLDTTFFNRTFWMYSKTWLGFNISNLAPKSGQLVVVGPKNTYAMKAYTSRYPLSPRYTPASKGYQLICDDNDNEPTLDKRAWAKDKGMGFSRSAPPVWNQWLPVRVRAMVLAGKHLAVCGPPDVLKKGDTAASFEGRMGSEFRIVSAADGKTLSTQKLKEVPIFDGMIVADGRLLMCTESGELICMKKK